MGWDAYFETLFQRIDRKMLDEDKVRYQGESCLYEFLTLEQLQDQSLVLWSRSKTFADELSRI